MLLVDTNILSELARRKPHPEVEKWASQVPLPIQISVITVEEIFFGLSSRSHPRLRTWFEHFFTEKAEVLVLTEAIARRAGELRGELRSRGHQRTQADMLIAATAQTHQLVLVTRNSRDFEGCGISLLNPFADVQS